MCGIAGIFSTHQLPPESTGWLRQMSRRLAHRGPDDHGEYHAPRAALASRRLSIVDLAGGHQPIASEDGAVQVVHNGEIYNHAALRTELQRAGHRFQSRCDSEVVVHAYEEWGDASLGRLDGIFAVAIWDAARQRLVLARDPLGVKPLYWAEGAGMLAFASEAKALHGLPFVRGGIDPEALDLFLAFRFVPAPATLFRGIRKLPAGGMLVAREEGQATRRRFAPAPPVPEHGRALAGWGDAVAARLASAVRRQRMGDVPVGVLLSGGADSAALLALAGDGPTHAYTVGFEAAPELDEVGPAAWTAGRFGAVHRWVRRPTADFVRELIRCAWHLDEPVGTPSVVPFDALCALAASERKVVLSGQGADEPFGGYGRHLAEALAGNPARPVLAAAAWLLGRVDRRRESWDRAARALARGDPEMRFTETLALFPSAARRRLRGTRITGVEPHAVVREIAGEAAHLDPLGRFLYLDSRFGLADDLLLYADKISMAHSLEVRVPFLDLELLALVERIPASVRMHRYRRKALLHAALTQLLPPEILRRRKRNFAPPVAAWAGADGDPEGLGWLLEPDAAVASYCERDAVIRLVQEVRRGFYRHARQAFALLAFEIWHRVFLDGRLPPPASR